MTNDVDRALEKILDAIESLSHTDAKDALDQAVAMLADATKAWRSHLGNNI